ncbi:Protein fam72a [Allomyces javanicus]|nr:Protein fam72a [Allomyces javanicus]KAJ3350893.1 Protein fam72a [Allomyces javanicus]
MAPVLHSSLATATSPSMTDVVRAATVAAATTLPRPSSARRNPAGSGFEWPSAAYTMRDRVDRVERERVHVRTSGPDSSANPPSSLAMPHAPPETNPIPGRNAAHWPTSARRNAMRAPRMLNQPGFPAAAAAAAEAAQLYYQPQQQAVVGYVPVRELPPGASSLRPVPVPAVPDTSVAHLHPQFRSKPVCDLSCRHCTRAVGQRGMKAILLADTKVELYSTDAPLVGAIQLVHDEYMTENCQCKINDVACLGCGNCIGYSVVAPCTSCLAACNNGHFYMFHSDGVKAMERVRDGNVLMWGSLAPAHLDRTCVAGAGAVQADELDDQDDDDEEMEEDDEADNDDGAPHPRGAAEAAEPATAVHVHDDDEDWMVTCR